MNVKTWMLACAATAQLTTASLAADKDGQSAASTNAVAVKVQTTCPVMGGDVDKTQFVDYEEKRIYVCCAGCIDKIKKDPAKYVKKLEAEGVILDKEAKYPAK